MVVLNRDGVRYVCAGGLFALLSWVSGCAQVDQSRFGEITKQNQDLRIEKIGLEERLQDRDLKIARLQSQLKNLRDQGLLQPEPLFSVERIVILGITGGVDTDGTGGDDAVAVYFRPVDRDGDVLKRAGQIVVRLLDLSSALEPRLVGHRVDNSSERIRESWYGKFWTNHYKIVVPFHPDEKLRPGQEIDVHVSFLELATGREFTARKVIKVSVPNPEATVSP